MVTAPLGEKVILDGVTRRSVLELVRGRLGGEVEVSERDFGMGEVQEAVGEGRVLEAFVCGTAVGFFVVWVYGFVERLLMCGFLVLHYVCVGDPFQGRGFGDSASGGWEWQVCRLAQDVAEEYHVREGKA